MSFSYPSGLHAAVGWDDVVLAIKSASLQAADTDASQTSMKDFMDFFKLLFNVFDTEYNRNGRGVLPVVSIVKMLQTMDGIFWHLGSCARDFSTTGCCATTCSAV